MNSPQLLAAINALIASRDNDGADVQPVIDSLSDQWEELNKEELNAPTATHIAHAEAVASMG